jgi:hypothetical protein
MVLPDDRPVVDVNLAAQGAGSARVSIPARSRDAGGLSPH